MTLKVTRRAFFPDRRASHGTFSRLFPPTKQTREKIHAGASVLLAVVSVKLPYRAANQSVFRAKISSVGPWRRALHLPVPRPMFSGMRRFVGTQPSLSSFTGPTLPLYTIKLHLNHLGQETPP